MASVGQIMTENYNDWGKDHDHVLQWSFPRSGRVWISRVIAAAIGQSMGVVNFDWRWAVDRSKFDDLPENPWCATHGNMQYELFPHAKYIWLVRDPRDSFRSLRVFCDRVGQPKRDWDAKIGHWCRVILQRFIGRLQGLDNVLLVQFEKMTLYPKRTARRILNFGGYTMVESFHPPEVCGWKEYCLHSLKWQRDDILSDKQLDIIWDLLGDWMLGLGYLRRGHDMEALLG